MTKADAFVRVRMEGLGPLVDTLENAVGILKAGELMRPVVKKAAEPIRKTYQQKAKAHDVTGNLWKSVKNKTKVYKSGVAVAIAGPEHTGTMGATGDKPSGNHSWLVEFGSNGRRKPKTRGKRKTYINVHKLINKRFKVVARLEDSEKFEKRSRGYYFIMSSFDEPTRQAKKGSGYPHDFFMTLKPGETYGPMPALGLMQSTISEKRSEVNSILRAGIVNAIIGSLTK
jgi:hypothetical protein